MTLEILVINIWSIMAIRILNVKSAVLQYENASTFRVAYSVMVDPRILEGDENTALLVP